MKSYSPRLQVSFDSAGIEVVTMQRQQGCAPVQCFGDAGDLIQGDAAHELHKGPNLPGQLSVDLGHLTVDDR